MLSPHRPRRWPLVLALFAALSFGHTGTANAYTATFEDREGHFLGSANISGNETEYKDSHGIPLGTLERNSDSFTFTDRYSRVLMETQIDGDTTTFSDRRGSTIATIESRFGTLVLMDRTRHELGRAYRFGRITEFKDASGQPLGTMDHYGYSITFLGPDGIKFGRVRVDRDPEVVIGPFGGFAPLEGPIQEMVAVFGPFGVMLSFAEPPCD